MSLPTSSLRRSASAFSRFLASASLICFVSSRCFCRRASSSFADFWRGIGWADQFAHRFFRAFKPPANWFPVYQLAKLLDLIGNLAGKVNQVAKTYNTTQVPLGFPEIMAIRRDVADIARALRRACEPKGSILVRLELGNACPR